MDTETTQPSLEAEYETLRAGLLAAHQPRNAHEQVLVEEFIDACWDLKAARRVGREFWSYAGGHYNRGEAGIAEAQFQEKESRFRTHLRYHAGCERSYYRALEALKPLSRDTRRPSATPRPAAAGPAPLEPGEPVLVAPERVHQVDQSIPSLPPAPASPLPSFPIGIQGSGYVRGHGRGRVSFRPFGPGGSSDLRCAAGLAREDRQAIGRFDPATLPLKPEGNRAILLLRT